MHRVASSWKEVQASVKNHFGKLNETSIVEFYDRIKNQRFHNMGQSSIYKNSTSERENTRRFISSSKVRIETYTDACRKIEAWRLIEPYNGLRPPPKEKRKMVQL